ncbi:CdaR family protein [Amphibacillus sediminis]|uniref:CdaR family protein n=1 Tax=Amphibacillus sediminis TaxID=360185 RepID=UPI000829ED3A|nr:CdaR family protein [Amphibacillus sediminis]
MNDWLNKPWVIRVISLFLAIIVFIVVSLDNQDTRSADVGGLDAIFNSSQETQVIEDVPVSIQIDDEQYVVSGVPQTVTMTIQGTISVVQSTVTQRNFDVFVDLEGLEPGTHTVPLQYEGISNRLSVSIEPEVIEVSIEERGTGDFTVEVDYTNVEQMQPGFEISSTVVSPSTVTVTSSKSVIDRIAIVKAFIDVEGIGESLTITDVPVRVYDSEGSQLNVRVEPETVTVELNVQSPNKTVPIHVETSGDLPDDFRLVSVEPEIDEVQVFAAEEDLEAIDQIHTKPIDLSEITETTSLDIELDVPDTARLISEEIVTVNIEVEERIEETIEDVEINIENLRNGLTPSFLNPETGALDINVIGFQSDLANLNRADFQLLIDLAGLTSGEYRVPIEVDAPNGIEVNLALEEATVQVE